MLACGPPPLTWDLAGAPHGTPHSNQEGSTFENPPMTATLGLHSDPMNRFDYRFPEPEPCRCWNVA